MHEGMLFRIPLPLLLCLELNIKGSHYCCISCVISLISKNEAINLMQNADLTKKGGIL